MTKDEYEALCAYVEAEDAFTAASRVRSEAISGIEGNLTIWPLNALKRLTAAYEAGREEGRSENNITIVEQHPEPIAWMIRNNGAEHCFLRMIYTTKDEATERCKSLNDANSSSRYEVCSITVTP